MTDYSGTYPANIVGTNPTSLYPSNVQTVIVRPPDIDGYHDVLLLDEDNEVVATGNRGEYRIKGALEGSDGYDIIVKEAQ